MNEEDQRAYEHLQRETGGERGELYWGGIQRYPLWQLIPKWLKELSRVGLVGGKARTAADVPMPEGMVPVRASDGRKVWIKPDAYPDKDRDLRAEVRDQYSRTDGAILAALQDQESVSKAGKKARFRISTPADGVCAV